MCHFPCECMVICISCIISYWLIGDTELHLCLFFNTRIKCVGLVVYHSTFPNGIHFYLFNKNREKIINQRLIPYRPKGWWVKINPVPLEVWSTCVWEQVLSLGCVTNSRFDIGVWEAVCVHGGEVGTADNAHHQARLLGTVLEGDHDTPSLLQGLVICLVDLRGKDWGHTGVRGQRKWAQWVDSGGVMLDSYIVKHTSHYILYPIPP